MPLTLRLIAVICVCLMTYASAWAQQAAVWVVAAESSVVNKELIDALRRELDRTPGGIAWSVLTPQQFAVASGSPRLIITVGSNPLATVAAAKPAPTAPVLATMLPRIAYEREVQRDGVALQSSAVFLDQPPSRQAALIRLALPAARRVGVLLGAESRLLASGLNKALSAENLVMFADDATTRGQLAALQHVLDNSDVLLALADPGVFNSETAANILTAAYRRAVPILAFSPAYVRAGALLGLFSTPAQVGAASAEVARVALSGKPLPNPASANDFVVEVNAAVAKSFGFSFDAAALQAKLRNKEGQP